MECSREVCSDDNNDDDDDAASRIAMKGDALLFGKVERAAEPMTKPENLFRIRIFLHNPTKILRTETLSTSSHPLLRRALDIPNRLLFLVACNGDYAFVVIPVAPAVKSRSCTAIASFHSSSPYKADHCFNTLQTRAASRFGT